MHFHPRPQLLSPHSHSHFPTQFFHPIHPPRSPSLRAPQHSIHSLPHLRLQPLPQPPQNSPCFFTHDPPHLLQSPCKLPPYLLHPLRPPPPPPPLSLPPPTPPS